MNLDKIAPRVYTLKFTEQEIDVIANALQNIAWRFANPVLGNLQQQMVAQVKQQELPLTGGMTSGGVQPCSDPGAPVKNGHDQAPAAGV